MVEPQATDACLVKGISETAMHWRKVPSSSNGKVVILALTALVAVSTVLLVLHFHA